VMIVTTSVIVEIVTFPVFHRLPSLAAMKTRNSP